MKIVFCTAGCTEALKHARNQLVKWGFDVKNELDMDVTHLLLPVPSIGQDGRIPGGTDLHKTTNQLSENAVVLGGMLPDLCRRKVDFLEDEFYLAENAAITAQCATQIIQKTAVRNMQDTTVLVIGWGRIGKCLVDLLRSVGIRISLAVRNEKDMAILNAMGYEAKSIKEHDLKKFDVICNTVPSYMLHESETNETSILIDLATQKGIEGERVIWARGLPNIMAPEASGMLIAKTALRYALGKE